jgi:hypothetical protein
MKEALNILARKLWKARFTEEVRHIRSKLDKKARKAIEEI